ncbi:NB-ARC domain-containing protein [Krasilnikovia cinnamomea]|uniref:NB-ARC domain-containing protein n=1 Tax=Krasilnikovia cinnamomea TaxID=349313 RepID=A0A4V2G6N5_9ACTN|nr:tetratricopeptide repeat protein [Krasilnikovia cinnamomea]RZU49376.1 NB-ARC domain-containing protein [Krasilnikovia cinnamomea]
MAGFSKHRWPADGPERELLEYLDELHRAHGQPSMARIGKAVGLAAGTVSAFFTAARPIGPERLEAVVGFLGGDAARAERLRRSAATVRNDRRAGLPVPAARSGSGPGWSAAATDDSTTRLDVILFDTAANRLNRPELMVGRQRLIETVTAWLDVNGRVLLYGLGGAGKTAIAATVADRYVDAHRGPYVWMRVGDADADVVLDGLARCLSTAFGTGGALPPPGDARLLAIEGQVSRAGIGLCVLDDVWNPAALHTVLQAIPANVAVLVTSRLRLGVEHQVEVDGLEAGEAVRLLAHHAHDDAVAAHPDAEALCRDLRFHPYLIEIAGHRLRQYALTPAELRRDVDGSPHELEMPAGFAAPGRQSGRRLLDTTIGALPHADARDALAAVGALFSGSVTPELLSCYLGVGLGRSRSALNALVDVSFAKRSGGTYVIHDLTVSYARTVLRDDGAGAKSAVAAVRDFVAAYADDHEVIARDLDNIVAAAGRARHSAVEDFVAIVETLAARGYLDTHGHTLALLRLLDAAIDLSRAQPGTERLHLLLSKRGNASFNAGEFDEAVGFYRDALALAPTAQRRVIMLSVIAKALAEAGRHEPAEETFAEAYALAEAEADEVGTMRVLEAHSVAAFRRHDYARVRELTERGVQLSRALGDRAAEAIFLNNLGSATFELGVETALRYHHEAKAIAVDTSNEHILAITHRCIGADYHAQEQFDRARQNFAEALRLYGRLGQTQREAKVRQLMRQFGYLTPAD